MTSEPARRGLDVQAVNARVASHGGWVLGIIVRDATPHAVAWRWWSGTSTGTALSLEELLALVAPQWAVRRARARAAHAILTAQLEADRRSPRRVPRPRRGRRLAGYQVGAMSASVRSMHQSAESEPIA
jgi:hypothetical protein